MQSLFDDDDELMNCDSGVAQRLEELRGTTKLGKVVYKRRI